MNRPAATLFHISLFVTSLTSCTTTPSKPESVKLPSRRLALFAAHQTLDSRGRRAEAGARSELASSVESVTGGEVVALDPGEARDLETAILESALRHAALLIYIQHPGGRPNGFVTAQAVDVVTGERLGDTSAPRQDERQVNAKVGSWLHEQYGTWDGSKTFRAKEFVSRLKKEKRCNAVVDFSNRYDPENDQERLDIEKLAMDCASQVSDEGASADSIRLLFYGVPKKSASRLTDAAVESGMREALGRLSHGLCEVAIHCANECGEGKVESRLYASPTTFSKEELQKIGGALLRFRASVSEISRFPVELHFVSNNGSDIIQTVTGSSTRPTITPVK